MSSEYSSSQGSAGARLLKHGSKELRGSYLSLIANDAKFKTQEQKSRKKFYLLSNLVGDKKNVPRENLYRVLVQVQCLLIGDKQLCVAAEEGGWLVELETKVHPKVRNHGEGTY